MKNRQLTTLQQKLVTENMKLVPSIACKFLGNGIPFEDLCQDGYLALCLSALNYDESKEAKFTTFATPHVWGYIYDVVKHERQVHDFINSLSEDDLTTFSDCIDTYTEADLDNRLKNLSDQERFIVKSFIGFGEERRNISELALHLNLNRHTISRTLRSAISKIPKPQPL